MKKRVKATPYRAQTASETEELQTGDWLYVLVASGDEAVVVDCVWSCGDGFAGGVACGPLTRPPTVELSLLQLAETLALKAWTCRCQQVLPLQLDPKSHRVPALSLHRP